MRIQPIRVLHVIGSLNMGGTEVFVMNMYRNIDRSKVQFDFAIFNEELNYFEPEVKNAGGMVFHFKQNSDNKYINCFSAIKQLIRFLKLNNYDVIHIHGCSQLELLRGSIASKIANTSIRIVHSHSVGTPQNSYVDKLFRELFKIIISKTSNRYFACSDLAAKSKFCNKIIKNNEVTYIHNAIDLSKYIYDKKVRDSLRKKLNLNDSALVLGHIGRLEKEKNHRFLIEILKEYHKFNNNVYLVFVGEGSLKDEITKTIDNNNLSEFVYLIGQVDNPFDYYQIFDIFLLPSFYEGFPFVAVEAQAMGLPCIFSNVMTEEVCILNSSKLLSIDLPPSAWVQSIEDLRSSLIDRFDINLRQYGYEITDEARRLEDFYLFARINN